MSIQTSTGVKIYISTQLPATFDLAGYGALMWTEIKEVTNIVPPSPSYQVVTHEPLKTGITQKNKGFVDYGDPTIDYALDTSDTGQQMLQSAASGATKNLEHSFKLTYPNGDIRYFSGRVFSSLEGGFSANSMVSGTSNVGVSRAVVKIPAISFAANYITNTYSILGESKTFADAHTFTRSTTATFIGSNGLIQSAAINAPRFTYDPVTLAPKGLLIEGSRTNLLTYSEQFNNGAWVKTGLILSTNAIASPDGNVTAEKITETAASEQHIAVSSSFSATNGSTYTASIFAKKAEKDILVINMIDAVFGAQAEAYFNLTTGIATTTNGTAKMTAHGGGWYKCEYSFTAISTISTTVGYAIDSIAEYLGDGTSGIYIWGAQLEAGSFASSYIPTTTAQVTRTADACTAKEFTSWYNQGEGSLFSESKLNSPNDTPNFFRRVFEFDSDFGLWYVPPSFDSVAMSGRTSSGSNFGGGISDTEYNKVGIKYTNAYFAGSDNGDTVTQFNFSRINQTTGLSIGKDAGSGNHLHGTIAQLNYYPTALSDEALQDLTR